MNNTILKYGISGEMSADLRRQIIKAVKQINARLDSIKDEIKVLETQKQEFKRLSYWQRTKLNFKVGKETMFLYDYLDPIIDKLRNLYSEQYELSKSSSELTLLHDALLLLKPEGIDLSLALASEIINNLSTNVS